MSVKRTLVLGKDETCVPNLPALLTDVIGDGFDFVAVPLVHPRNRRDCAATGVSAARPAAFTRSDLLMPSTNWTRSVVGKLSPWLWPAIESAGPNGEQCPARRNAEDALRQELAWASHLSLPAVLFPQLPALQRMEQELAALQQEQAEERQRQRAEESELEAARAEADAEAAAIEAEAERMAAEATATVTQVPEAVKANIRAQLDEHATKELAPRKEALAAKRRASQDHGVSVAKATSSTTPAGRRRASRRGFGN
mgnify:CR=1 FL=1